MRRPSRRSGARAISPLRRARRSTRPRRSRGSGAWRPTVEVERDDDGAPLDQGEQRGDRFGLEVGLEGDDGARAGRRLVEAGRRRVATLAPSSAYGHRRGPARRCAVVSPDSSNSSNSQSSVTTTPPRYTTWPVTKSLCVGKEEVDDVGDVGERAQAGDGQPAERARRSSSSGTPLMRSVGIGPGPTALTVMPSGAELAGQHPGERLDRGLGRHVGGLARQRQRHGDGGDVDDAPAACGAASAWRPRGRPGTCR